LRIHNLARRARNLINGCDQALEAVAVATSKEIALIGSDGGDIAVADALLFVDAVAVVRAGTNKRSVYLLGTR